jgi:hypothetical protein
MFENYVVISLLACSVSGANVPSAHLSQVNLINGVHHRSSCGMTLKATIMYFVGHANQTMEPSGLHCTSWLSGTIPVAELMPNL